MRVLVGLKASFHSGKLSVEQTSDFFFVLKSLVPTPGSQDKEKLLSYPRFQFTDNFLEWKLALLQVSVQFPGFS
jgi:hypothetical protein